MKEIIDGKINDIEYDNASCKILWILKEDNISAEDKEKEIDVCEGFRNDWHKKKSPPSAIPKPLGVTLPQKT